MVTVAALAALFISVSALSWCWRRRNEPEGIHRWWIGIATAVLMAAVAIVSAVVDLQTQKTVALLAMPAGLAWVALAVTAGVLLRRGAYKAGGRVIACWLLWSLAGNAWLGGWLMHQLERTVPVTGNLAHLPHLDAVVVLGGGTDITPSGDGQLGAAGDRVFLAMRLYFLGKADQLVAVGRNEEPARDLAADTAQLWRSVGIETSAIRTLSQPRTTSEEIAAVAMLARERGWHRVGLITSAWHLPRALAHCRRHQLEVVPVAADWRGHVRPAHARWLVPQREGFELVQLACWEYIGLAVGR